MIAALRFQIRLTSMTMLVGAWPSCSSWHTPCTTSVRLGWQDLPENGASVGPGVTAGRVLRQMLARDPLTPAMRQDLVYVLHTIEELAAQLLETGHYAEASAKQNIDSRGQGLDVHTKQFLLQLTKPDQTTKFKHVALLVIFIVRIQMMVHAHAPRGRRGSIADKARLKRSVTPSAANSASEAAFANMQRIVNFDLPVRRASNVSTHGRISISSDCAISPRAAR